MPSLMMPRSHQTFRSVLAVKIARDYVKKWMMAHHFSHCYNRRCRQMVSGLPGVIGPSKQPVKTQPQLENEDVA